MTISTEALKYSAAGSELHGHLAYDDAASGVRPGVLIIHEGGGVNNSGRPPPGKGGGGKKWGAPFSGKNFCEIKAEILFGKASKDIFYNFIPRPKL